METAEQYEIRQLENELKHIQSSMMEHIRQVEKSKVDAESKVRQLEVSLVTAKSNAESDLGKLRSKLKEEHDRIIEDHVAQVKSLTDKKDRMEAENEKLTSQLRKVEAEKTALLRQNDSLRKQNAELEEVRLSLTTDSLVSV